MLTKNFTIIKKNRKYFDARTGSYKCKIVIDENSQDLAPGEIELVVDDLSIITKYGTSFIYKLSSSVKEQIEANICTLKHYCYNEILVERCRQLGGRWDANEQIWVFSSIVEDKVEELDFYFNEDIKDYEITFTKQLCNTCSPITAFGVIAATVIGHGRNRQVINGNQIAFISGEISYGGSQKYWQTIIEAETVMRLQLPRKIVEDYKERESRRKGISIREILN